MVNKINNFLSRTFFNEVNNNLNGSHFTWCYNTSSLPSNIYPFNTNSNMMFSHLIYMQKESTQNGQDIVSQYFNNFKPILDSINKKIKIKKLFRMKLNLYVNQNKKIEHAPHYDVMLSDQENKPNQDVTIGILNFTTCNGGTKIGNKFYPSKANELLLFNNTQKHSGTVQTDSPVRIVLNMCWQ